MARSRCLKKLFHNKAPDDRHCGNINEVLKLSGHPYGRKKCPNRMAGHGGKLFGRTFGMQSLRKKWLCTKEVPLCGEPVPEVLLSRLP